MSRFRTALLTSRLRFLEVAIVMIAALAAQIFLRPVLGGHTYMFLYPALMWCCMRGGFWPGLLSVAVVICSKAFLPASFGLMQDSNSSRFAALWFCCTGIAISIFGQKYLLTRTEEKRSQSAMQAAKEEAEAANLAKSRFLANMSHEIRTPLSAIVGFTDLAMEQGVSIELAAQLATIKRNAEHLIDILSEILDLSKIEADKLQIEDNEFSPREAVESVIGALQLQAEANSVKIRLQADKAPALIRSDRKRFRQIAQNLIDNAVKFTRDGEVRIKLGLTSPPVEGFPMTLELEVTNTGMGISREQKNNLFRPFFQADSSPTRRYGGTGNGLALSRLIARKLGGDVVLRQSQTDAGSTFVLSVKGGPFVGLQQPAEINQKEIRFTPTHHPGLKGMRVLVAEDSSDNQLLIGMSLKAAGVIVDIADNGLEALEKAQSKDFDAILMDLQMPVMDGHQATAELRKAGFKRPIIALTAHALREEKERALEAGFTAYLTKPIERKTLFAALEQNR